MALLVEGGRAELGHPHVAGVEGSDEPPDGAALAGGIPALEQDAHRGTEPLAADQATEDEAQVQQPGLGMFEALCLLLLA